MHRLTPPKPNIELYKHGFTDAKDQLERAQTGTALSELVQRIEEPMVIALDGGWGTGKSFFLQCWVGQHLKDEKHHAQTVYFDAFKHDFIDEPLISLMGVIEDRFDDEHVKDRTLKNRFAGTVKVAKKLLKPGLRIGAGVMSYGLSEVAVAAIGTEKVDTTVDSMVDAGVKRIGAEASSAIDDLWENEAGRWRAMEEFRESLVKLTAPDLPLPDKTDKGQQDDAENNTHLPKKLVIVIDELDRCRPDYALSLLEIIKHFFDVPHVHFVLGANMRELQNSVSARYGAGIDAALYLQKFVTLTMRLPEHLNGGRGRGVAERYFEQMSLKMELEIGLVNIVQEITSWIKEPNVISLRGFERLVSVLAITPSVWRPNHFHARFDDELSRQFLVLLIVVKTWFPETFAKAGNGTLLMEDLHSVFEIESFNEESRSNGVYQIVDELEYHLAPEIYDARNRDPQTGRPRVRAKTMRDFRFLVVAALEVFEIN